VSRQLASVTLGTLGLDVALLIALWLTLSRAPTRGAGARLERVRRVAAAAVALQLVHFLEEWHSGFHVRFPQLVGLAPWSSEFFVAFNAAWLVVWAACAALLRAERPALLLPLWFLAVASLANGVAHPLLAAAVRGYFPGLWSSLAVGAAGVFLLRALAAATAPRRSALRA